MSNGLYHSWRGLEIALFVLGWAAAAYAQTRPPALTPQGPAESLSTSRARILLNGFWRFMPATGPAAQAPNDDWGVIPVPGTWQRSGWVSGNTRMTDTRARGTGPQWNDLGPKLGRAWYEREIEIPADWADRAVVLDFRRVSTDAVVWVDGVKCGEVAWPYGEVDITRAVTPGRRHTLRVLVVATPDPGESIVWMGTAPGQSFTVKSELHRSGLIGEVWLLARPRAGRVSDVFVRPSFREKRLHLDVELADVSQAGEVEFVARMLDEQGREEIRFSARANVRATAQQTVTLTFDWPNPRLWDVGQPNLYTLMLSARGADLADEYPQRFGFRELWIEGRSFVLNGVPIRFRPVLPDEPFDVEEMDGVIDGLFAAGFNISQFWPTDHDKRGNAFQHREVFVERADAKGWPVIGALVSLAPYIVDTSWRVVWNAERRDRWTQRMEADWRRYRNHPSVLMWCFTPNFYNHASDQDPRHIGRRGFAPGDDTDARVQAGLEAFAILRRLDPTRPFFTHAGNRMGDVYTLNHYLNLIPLQEREEHLSEYARDGEMPAMSVEFGNLIHCDVMRGRNGFANNIRSEPWLTEFAAIYLGPDAYRREWDAYRKAIVETYQGGQRWKNWQHHEAINHNPVFVDLNALFIRNTYRAWRTWGYEGGMLYWDVQQGVFRRKEQLIAQPPPAPGARGAWLEHQRMSNLQYLKPEGGWQINDAGRALLEVNGPTLAYIAGPPDDFTDKDARFWAGARVEKSVIVINDERAPQPYRLRWSAVLGDQELVAGELTGEARPAVSLRLPIAFDLPKEIAAKTDGEIRLEGTIGERAHSDRFAFRVFPPPEPVASLPLRLYDPRGESARLFETLGFAVHPWTPGEPLAKDELLVLGRRALSDGPPLPDGLLERLVGEGGRVLMLAQDPDWLRRQVGFRVNAFPARRVFPTTPGHPLWEGLDERDLRDWNGAGTLIEARPRYDAARYPRTGWRWGNRGSVSSAPVEKPHFGAWRPLLDCEFDLAWSPLLELDYGRGRLTLCTLDLEDHAAVDPVARMVAARVVRHAATAPLRPRVAKTYYIGGPRGRELLQQLGVRFEATEAIPRGAPLVVLGEEHGVSAEALRRHLAGGGKALLLDAVRAETRTAPAFAEPPPWPETEGISISDLHTRADIEQRLLPEIAGAQIAAGGLLGRLENNGVAIWALLDPNGLDTKKNEWLRFTRWRRLRAVSQILANLGASFAADARIFRPLAAEIPLTGEWRAKMIQPLPASPEPAKKHPWTPTSENARSAAANLPDDAEPVAIPSEYGPFRPMDGEALFWKEVELPAAWAGQLAELSLGAIDDYDEAFINGVSVGATTDRQPNAWIHRRVYRVPPGVLRAGRNLIAVRVLDVYGGGGMTGQPEDLRLRLTQPEKAPRFYDPDYREDFELGDEPYRYYRW